MRYSLIRADKARTFNLMAGDDVVETVTRDDMFAKLRGNAVLPNGERWRTVAGELAVNDEFFAIGIRKNFDAETCDDILGAEMSAEGVRRRWAKLHDKLEQEPRVVYALAGVCILIFLVVAYGALSSGRTPTVLQKSYWFFDMNTGELFTETTADLPPIPAPSGALADGSHAGARAYVFSCGACDDEDQRFLAFIGITRVDEPKPLLRRPDEDDWVSMSSREGFALMDEARSRCGDGAKLAECFP